MATDTILVPEIIKRIDKLTWDRCDFLADLSYYFQVVGQLKAYLETRSHAETIAICDTFIEKTGKMDFIELNKGGVSPGGVNSIAVNLKAYIKISEGTEMIGEVPCSEAIARAKAELISQLKYIVIGYLYSPEYPIVTKAFYEIIQALTCCIDGILP